LREEECHEAFRRCRRPGVRDRDRDTSDVDARRDGRIEVKVEGLVIAGRGTVGIAAVTASLYCGGELVGTTAPAPLSLDGDAEIRDTIAAAPDECLAPAVFVSPDGRPNVYFAVTGA
jgi:hypothetical protein